MPFEGWFLIGVVALGFLLWLLEDVIGWRVADHLGRTLAVLFLLATLGGLIYGVVQIIGGGGGSQVTQPERDDCFPYGPSPC